MPLSRDELEALAATDVMIPIGGDVLSAALSTPPFIPSRSLINARDSGAVPGSAIPAGRIFRCGVLDSAGRDPEAVAWLSSNVKRVFDFRKADERENTPDPDVPGVVNLWYPTDGEYPTPQIAAFAPDDGRAAWKEQLLIIAEMYAPTVKAMLEHVRDQPSEPFLFHCTAGRDRTGFAACLLHSLAGSPSDTIILDYMLSRIGTEVAREKLLKFAMHQLNITDETEPGLSNLFNLRPSFVLGLVEGIEEKYGGWDGYVTNHLGFSAEDLATIKKNLQS